MNDNLQKEYLNAVYVVVDKGLEIKFRIGSYSMNLDELLKSHHAAAFAFITAYNPRSERLSVEENKRRQSLLTASLKSKNYRFIKGFGTNEDESWEREESLLIFDIEIGNAMRLAQRFEQNAFVYGTEKAAPRLIWNCEELLQN